MFDELEDTLVQIRNNAAETFYRSVEVQEKFKSILGYVGTTQLLVFVVICLQLFAVVLGIKILMQPTPTPTTCTCPKPFLDCLTQQEKINLVNDEKVTNFIETRVIPSSEGTPRLVRVNFDAFDSGRQVITYLPGGERVEFSGYNLEVTPAGTKIATWNAGRSKFVFTINPGYVIGYLEFDGVRLNVESVNSEYAIVWMLKPNG